MRWGKKNESALFLPHSLKAHVQDPYGDQKLELLMLVLFFKKKKKKTRLKESKIGSYTIVAR